jgi:hypothetical protein
LGEPEDLIEAPYNYNPLMIGVSSGYLFKSLETVGGIADLR